MMRVFNRRFDAEFDPYVEETADAASRWEELQEEASPGRAAQIYREIRDTGRLIYVQL